MSTRIGNNGFSTHRKVNTLQTLATTFEGVKYFKYTQTNGNEFQQRATI